MRAEGTRMGNPNVVIVTVVTICAGSLQVAARNCVGNQFCHGVVVQPHRRQASRPR